DLAPEREERRRRRYRETSGVLARATCPHHPVSMTCRDRVWHDVSWGFLAWAEWGIRSPKLYGCYSIRRRRRASATAAVRSEVPSFSKMCSRCVLTVSGEM